MWLLIVEQLDFPGPHTPRYESRCPPSTSQGKCGQNQCWIQITITSPWLSAHTGTHKHVYMHIHTAIHDPHQSVSAEAAQLSYWPLSPHAEHPLLQNPRPMQSGLKVPSTHVSYQQILVQSWSRCPAAAGNDQHILVSDLPSCPCMSLCPQDPEWRFKRSEISHRLLLRTCWWLQLYLESRGDPCPWCCSLPLLLPANPPHHRAGFVLPVTPQFRSSLPMWLSGEESTCQCKRHRRCGFDPWVGRIPWSRKWQPTPVFLPGKSHGQRNVAGYSPWACRVRHNWAHGTFAEKPYWTSLSHFFSP